MKTQLSTTIGPIGVVISQGLTDLGIDPSPLFEAAGINLDSLTDPNTRIPAEAIRKLLTLVEKQPGTETFGLSLTKFIHPTTFYSLGVAAYCSNTLGEYLERMARYYALVTTNDTLELEDHGEQFFIRWNRSSAIPLPAIREDGIAAIFYTILRIATQNRFVLTRVELARPLPTVQRERYQEFFDCVVNFDARQTMLVFDRQLINLELTSADPEMATAYEQLTEQYVDQLQQMDFPSRVQNELIRLLPVGISSKEHIAKALCVSTRTLYNRLDQAGTTYREILDETRKILATDYLSEGLSVYEIAYLTGFSDTANFSRAFKKWTGHAPSIYRAVLLEAELSQRPG